MALLPAARPPAMDDPFIWAQVTTQAQLDDPFVQALGARGYVSVSSSFYALSEPTDMEWVIWELLVSVENLGLGVLTDENYSFSPQAGRLRRLWAECSSICNGSPPQGALGAQPTQTKPQLELMWQDAPPPRVDVEIWRQLKMAFLANYPSEILNRSNTPSEMYFAKVYEACLPGRALKWVPWKNILSVEESEKAKELKMEAMSNMGKRTMENMSKEMWDYAGSKESLGVWTNDVY